MTPNAHGESVAEQLREIRLICLTFADSKSFDGVRHLDAEQVQTAYGEIAAIQLKRGEDVRAVLRTITHPGIEPYRHGVLDALQRVEDLLTPLTRGEPLKSFRLLRLTPEPDAYFSCFASVNAACGDALEHFAGRLKAVLREPPPPPAPPIDWSPITEALKAAAPPPVVRPTCTYEEAMKSTSRKKGTLSHWATSNPDLVAERNPQGRVTLLYTDVLNRISAEKSRRRSEKSASGDTR